MRKVLLCVICWFMCLVSTLHCYAIIESAEHDVLLISSKAGDIRSADIEIAYRKDDEGKIHGPIDYTMDGEKLFILNNTDNTILQYQEGQLRDTIALNDYGVVGINIAYDHERLYVYGNDQKVYGIREDTCNVLLDLKEYGFPEAVSDFKIIKEYLYIGNPFTQPETTYRFEIMEEEIIENPEIFTGYFADENTLVTEENVGEGAGRKKKITITYIDINECESFLVDTEFYLDGVRYLGKNHEGNHIIYVIESRERKDFTSVTSETLRIVGTSGKVISIRQLNQQKKYIPRQYRMIQGEIVALNCLDDSVQACIIRNENFCSLNTYVSPLSKMNETNCIIEEIVDLPVRERNLATGTISRDDIMNTAEEYRTSFRWSCEESNIASMTNYTKPRYINGAGEYTNMPYCWGGWTKTDEFQTDMGIHGRAGNINCTTTGRVSSTYGVDCSGYVSRCWNLSTKHSTSTLGNVASTITFSSIKKGDALVISGYHVMLFSHESGGMYYTYEATKTNSYDKVVYTCYSVSEIKNSGYTPIRYDNVE